MQSLFHIFAAAMLKIPNEFTEHFLLMIDKMKKAFFLLLSLVLFSSCSGQKRDGGDTEVILETTLGDVHIVLFDDTPLHRDNIVENVKNGVYDGVMFHRVIRNFMVQTGDPMTKVDAGDSLTGKRIQAEIVYPKYYHRRGMVGGARDGDEENPERGSDPFQFYIVTGKTCSEPDLDGYESAREEREAQRLFESLCEKHKAEIDDLRAARQPRRLSDRLESLLDEARLQVSERPPLTFTKAQRSAYRSKGGAPWLDGEYTVFGEVVEGMAVVEKIQKIKTNEQDVPLAEVRILRAYVKE